jgi:hypothetical protein
MGFEFHHHVSGLVTAAPQVLFDHLDDPHHLASHMESGSSAMLGASMSVETDTLHGKAIGSVIRMRGRMLGFKLFLVEAVTSRDPPYLKEWTTVGKPRLLVIGGYRMGFRIEDAGPASRLTVLSTMTCRAAGWAASSGGHSRPLMRGGAAGACWRMRHGLSPTGLTLASPTQTEFLRSPACTL